MPLPLLGPRDPAQPLLTLLGAAGRVELSGATTLNWVAKTANLLHASGTPQRVGLLLPLHWQAVTLLLGAVATGATAVLAGDVDELTGCDLVFVTAQDAAAALAVCDGDVLAVSTAPLGGRLRDLPAMVLDAGAELPVQADAFQVPPLPGGAVELRGVAVAAPAVDLAPGDRLLTVLGPADPVGLPYGLLAPLAAGSALVLAPGPAVGLTRELISAEGITACVGVDVDGARRLD